MASEIHLAQKLPPQVLPFTLPLARLVFPLFPLVGHHQLLINHELLIIQVSIADDTPLQYRYLSRYSYSPLVLTPTRVHLQQPNCFMVLILMASQCRQCQYHSRVVDTPFGIVRNN